MSQPVDLPFIMSVLRAANQSGVLSLALQNLSQENADVASESGHSWDLIPNGAMTDGSKRRLSPSPSEEAVIESKENLRSAKELWARLEESAVDKLPSGVSSMKVWSKTLITFGKFEKEKLSYFDLVTDADVNKMSYVKWIVGHTNDKSSAQLKDLCAFIKIFQTGQESKMIRFADGTLREFKKWRTGLKLGKLRFIRWSLSSILEVYNQCEFQPAAIHPVLISVTTAASLWNRGNISCSSGKKVAPVR